MGVETLALIGMGVGLAGSVATGLMQKKPEQPRIPPPKPLEERPGPRYRGMAGTLLTGGQGVLGQPPVVRKTLLGE